ncbi:hypothetical protein [Micromonospora sp. NBC_01638]|uniref:hypothetical protein n=1 Tax=Micromonospora sp. NBC_01638 TaxID=2975982 RepID=UPI00386A80E1|nr:hypothetical protein OG811_29495 [Micromonospora sp. NBC_01638]
MNKVGKLSVVAAAAAATILVTGSSAYADASSSVAGSWSRFISYGDKFENCDTAEDGLISYVAYEYVRIDGSLQTGSHYNPGSNGDCSQWDHNFGEGRTVRFRSCVDQPAWFADTCDKWRTGVA